MGTLSDPSNSVVHLQLRKGKENLAIGSGVLYERAGGTYIITAWHNVTGRHTESLKCLSKTLATPDNAIVTFACRLSSHGSKVGYIRRSITFLLERDGKATYYVHPQGWPRVDVVAIPLDLDREYVSEYRDASGREQYCCSPLVQRSSNGSVDSDIEHIQDAELSASGFGIDFSTHLYASDDVFILGYPKGITDYTVQPIWKRASVATSPHLGWNRQSQFLIDCASTEGMSGAPAIFYNRKGSIQVANTSYFTAGPAAVLHGIYVGRLNVTSQFEAQLGIVWKRSVIDETIDHEEFGPASDEICLLESEVSRCIEDNWPDTENYAESVLDENCHYKAYFVNSIMASLHGRANPDDVRALVVKYARKLLSGDA